MVSEQYDNVVIKRLRLRHWRGGPRRRRNRQEVASILKNQSAGLVQLAAERGLFAELEGGAEDFEHQEVPLIGEQSVADEGVQENSEVFERREKKYSGEADEDSQEDSKTAAEKHFEDISRAREKERLRRIASQSYKEQVDSFNKKLASEPEHFDLFKVSHTK